MINRTVSFIVLLILLFNWTVANGLREPLDEEHEQNDEASASSEYSVQFDPSLSKKEINIIAKRAGFTHVRDVPEIGKNFYRLILEDDSPSSSNSNVNGEEDVPVSKRDHIEIKKRLSEDNSVRWLRREVYLEREKRVPLPRSSDEEKVERFIRGLRNSRVSRNAAEQTTDDPESTKEYYLSNTGQTNGPTGFDSCVWPVWNQGFFGKGIRTTILDDGMDYTHLDLHDQYDNDSSTDLNGNDDDPFPNDKDPYNAHGTKCAGTIAAQRDNKVCGVGIAPDSKVGSIRMLDGKATDGLEANALSFHRDYIHQYSCSWGPKDNGKTFGRPGHLGRIALEQGAKLGRGGLGSLFVWATGNGGIMQDDCNADGYVNSIYTIGIGSVNEYGVSTYYGEECTPTLAVTYCSGKHSAYDYGAQAHVVTTYLHHQCTDNFVGTSSAAPLAAGIFALVLEANPFLSWRDMQHIIVNTVKKTSPLDEGWRTNGAGFHFNHKFGFGVLQACKMVNLARNWTKVSTHRSCHFKLNFRNGTIPSGHHFKLNFTTDGCQHCKKSKQDKSGQCNSAVHSLEHVQVKVTLKHRCRGHLTIRLISPHGTVSRLLHLRPNDNSPNGLKGWSFMTVFKWGEDPAGTWQLFFDDNMGKPTKKKDPNKRDMEEVYMKLMDRNKRSSNHEYNIQDITENLNEEQRSNVVVLQDALRAEDEKQEVEEEDNKYEDHARVARSADNEHDRVARNADNEEPLLRDAYDQYYRSFMRNLKPDKRSVADVEEDEKRVEVQDDADKRVETQDPGDDDAELMKRWYHHSAEHKCVTDMHDPKLKTSDIAGEVLQIAITLYGVRNDSA